ncbi:MAG: hypothetical protein LBU32_18600 [Clostridiales bacterium]|jgi:hypothetical protein|nr:hypothetical protein [Clostridiales bacterium]
MVGNGVKEGKEQGKMTGVMKLKVPVNCKSCPEMAENLYEPKPAHGQLTESESLCMSLLRGRKLYRELEFVERISLIS